MSIIFDLLRENGAGEEQAKALERYAELLAEANEKINLTRISSPEEVVYKHLLDSISAEGYIPEGARVLDLGTGGGMPGIPLSIVRPDLQVTMLDATENKLKFVAGFVEALGLSSKTVWGRAEEKAHGEMRGRFDVVVSRAVANLAALTELCAPFLKIGGIFIAYKGQGAAEEVLAAKSAGKKLGLSDFRIIDSRIGEYEHKLVLAEKIAETPDNLPRSWAQIKKRAL